MRMCLRLAIATVVLGMTGAATGRLTRAEIMAAQQVIPCPSKWKLIRAEYDGEGVDEAALEFSDMSGLPNCLSVWAKIKGEVVLYHFDREYKLRPESFPAELDVRGDPGEQGIYAFDGKRLKVCFGPPWKPRPRRFWTMKGDNLLLLEMKLERP